MFGKIVNQWKKIANYFTYRGDFDKYFIQLDASLRIAEYRSAPLEKTWNSFYTEESARAAVEIVRNILEDSSLKTIPPQGHLYGFISLRGSVNVVNTAAWTNSALNKEHYHCFNVFSSSVDAQRVLNQIQRTLMKIKQKH